MAADVVDQITATTTCDGLAAGVIDGLQVHVDAFATTAAEQVARRSVELAPRLAAVADAAGTQAAALGCTGAEYRDQLVAQLDRMDTGNGVQRAVAATFASGIVGGDDPSDPDPSTVEVASADELAVALVRSGSGSTIRLAAGTYRITSSLVVLRPITLVGAGRDATTITSSASDAALIIATRGVAQVRGLTIENMGRAASVVAVTRGGLEMRDSAIMGARTGDGGGGGFGLALAPDTSLDRVELRVESTIFRDNARGGILVDGMIDPVLDDIEVHATTGCGVCWTGGASGHLAGSNVTGGEVGLRVDGAATPEIRDVVTSAAQVGIVVSGQAAPQVRDVRIDDAVVGLESGGDSVPVLTRVEVHASTDVGLRLAGSSRASVDDVTITGSPVGGIIVAGEAAPVISGGSVAGDGEVGVLVGGNASASLAAMSVRNARIGVQVGDTATLAVTDLVVTSVAEVAVLVVQQGGGSLHRVTCDDDDTGMVGLQAQSTMAVDESVVCRVVEADG